MGFRGSRARWAKFEAAAAGGGVPVCCACVDGAPPGLTAGAFSGDGAAGGAAVAPRAGACAKPPAFLRRSAPIARRTANGIPRFTPSVRRKSPEAASRYDGRGKRCTAAPAREPAAGCRPGHQRGAQHRHGVDEEHQPHHSGGERLSRNLGVASMAAAIRTNAPQRSIRGAPAERKATRPGQLPPPQNPPSTPNRYRARGVTAGSTYRKRPFEQARAATPGQRRIRRSRTEPAFLC